MANFPPSNPRDRNLLVVAVLFLALAGVYAYLVYLPKNAELALLDERVEALQELNDKAKREMAKGSADELRAQAQQYRANLDLMRQLVPTGNEVPALLEQVSTAARRVGLDISEVNPEPVIPGEQFDTYRYQINVIGDYHALGEFLANVGSLTRIVAPINVNVSTTTGTRAPKGGRVASKKDVPLELKFQIQTYVARNAPRNAPPTTREVARAGGST